MSELPRILVVSPYSFQVPGGVQNQVKGIAHSLHAMGIEVAVLAPAASEEVATFPVFTAGRSFGVPVNGSRAPIALHVSALTKSLAAMKSFRPNIIHVHEPFVPGPALTCALAHRCLTVATFHRAGASIPYRALRPLLSVAMNKIDDVVAVSDLARDTLVKVAGKRAENASIISNAVDVARFEHVEPWPKDELTIAFVGRHESRKGLRVLLEAFCRSAVKAKLWVIGEGPETPNLQFRYAADPRVEWCGKVDDEELTRRLGAADVFVAPSLSGESFGVVLIEAMAAGTAVIASDLEGYRLAGGDVPRYVEPGDIDGLRKEIERVCADVNLRSQLAEDGIQHAAGLDFSSQARRYLERYELLLENER